MLLSQFQFAYSRDALLTLAQPNNPLSLHLSSLPSVYAHLSPAPPPKNHWTLSLFVSWCEPVFSSCSFLGLVGWQTWTFSPCFVCFDRPALSGLFFPQLRKSISLHQHVVARCPVLPQRKHGPCPLDLSLWTACTRQVVFSC